MCLGIRNRPADKTHLIWHIGAQVDRQGHAQIDRLDHVAELLAALGSMKDDIVEKKAKKKK